MVAGESNEPVGHSWVNPQLDTDILCCHRRVNTQFGISISLSGCGLIRQWYSPYHYWVFVQPNSENGFYCLAESIGSQSPSEIRLITRLWSWLLVSSSTSNSDRQAKMMCSAIGSTWRRTRRAVPPPRNISPWLDRSPRHVPICFSTTHWILVCWKWHAVGLVAWWDGGAHGRP